MCVYTNYKLQINCIFHLFFCFCVLRGVCCCCMSRFNTAVFQVKHYHHSSLCSSSSLSQLAQKWIIQLGNFEPSNDPIIEPDTAAATIDHNCFFCPKYWQHEQLELFFLSLEWLYSNSQNNFSLCSDYKHFHFSPSWAEPYFFVEVLLINDLQLTEFTPWSGWIPYSDWLQGVH